MMHSGKKPKNFRKIEDKPIEYETCSRCAGTGLVCGHEPSITPGSCCADWANAICPDCGGTGKKALTYRVIDHTADFGIHVFGADPKALFANAARAMFEQMAETGEPKAGRTTQIRMTGDDWPDLMINWLRELLYFWSGKEMLVSNVEILSLSEFEISAKIHFVPFDAHHHNIQKEIKAVTYHQIQVFEGECGWEAKIIFDI